MSLQLKILGDNVIITNRNNTLSCSCEEDKNKNNLCNHIQYFLENKQKITKIKPIEKDKKIHYFFKTPINKIQTIYILFIHIIAFKSIYMLHSFQIFFHLLLWCFFSGIGITAGIHRLWAHRSYKATLPYRVFLMILTSISNQGTIYHWCRDHRLHHKYADTELDPHNIQRGFFYSHMGWLLLQKNKKIINEGKKIMTKDLLTDPVVRFNLQYNPYLNQFCCFILPGLWGIWLLKSFWIGFFILGFVRLVIVWHLTWTINSFAHMWGERPYKEIQPTDHIINSILSSGEGWHNWHHTYPYDYAASEHGICKQWNPTKLFIDFFWLLRQTYDHKRHIIKKN